MCCVRAYLQSRVHKAGVSKVTETTDSWLTSVLLVLHRTPPVTHTSEIKIKYTYLYTTHQIEIHNTYLYTTQTYTQHIFITQHTRDERFLHNLRFRAGPGSISIPHLHNDRLEHTHTHTHTRTRYLQAAGSESGGGERS